MIFVPPPPCTDSQFPYMVTIAVDRTKRTAFGNKSPEVVEFFENQGALEHYDYWDEYWSCTEYNHFPYRQMTYFRFYFKTAELATMFRLCFDA